MWCVARILPMILVSSANILHDDFIFSGRSYMKIANNSGPSTDPCGTPLEDFERQKVFALFTLTIVAEF